MSNENANSNSHTTPRWQLALRRLFTKIWVDLLVGLMVVISVVLTFYEFVLHYQPGLNQQYVAWVERINDGITVLFMIELTLRFFAARTKSEYFREFWIDILATLPLFRAFRISRALRLLRLVRIFRLFGVASRLTNHYPYVIRKGALDFIVVTSMLGVAVLFGTVAMMYFEHQPQVAATPEASEFNLENSFWYSMYTLFAGEPIPGPPRTLAGRITTVFIMFTGLTIFAIFAGTVSAFMVDRIRMEGRVATYEELEGHIIICGWSNKAEIIIREYRASAKESKTPIVVIAEQSLGQVDLPKDLAAVYLMSDDFTKVSALERAGIRQANTCIILSDLINGRSEQDADARTILAALTVEKINPAIYTCAELINRSYGSHLDLGHVNEYVVSGEHSAYMLAQAAMNRGLMDVLNELLTYQRGNEFFRAALPTSWVGHTFDDLLAVLRAEGNAILVGVYVGGSELLLNPIDYHFQAGDEVVTIARAPFQIVEHSG